MDGIPAEVLHRTAQALRYVQWRADLDDRRVAGADFADDPPCPVPDSELAALAIPLAALVLAARRALADWTGASGPAECAQRVQDALAAELEGAEMNAAFAAVEAEAGDQPG